MILCTKWMKGDKAKGTCVEIWLKNPVTFRGSLCWLQPLNNTKTGFLPHASEDGNGCPRVRIAFYFNNAICAILGALHGTGRAASGLPSVVSSAV